MAGRGSLAGLMPYGDANAIVHGDGAARCCPSSRDTPVLAGVCGTDPFRLMDRFLREVLDAGFAGVQNFPTVGLIDGTFRANLEETGMGYELEVEMIREARQLGLLTAPYVFDPTQAAAMAEAGADVLVPHMGLTTKGTIGAQTAKTLDQCVEEIQAMRDAAVAREPRRDRALPRRAAGRARGRRVRARPHRGHRRLLRRLEHGAPADRDRDDREHAPLQGARRQELTRCRPS